MAEQLSVDQLRTEFRKYIKTKIAQELIDFYQDSLDREEVEDFFERQVRPSLPSVAISDSIVTHRVLIHHHTIHAVDSVFRQILVYLVYLVYLTLVR